MPRSSAATSALQEMVARRAVTEGRTDSAYAGLRYYRYSRRTAFRKTQVLLPGVVLVLQGRKSARFAERTLLYDPGNYLVMAREAVCEATVVEATPAAPYLAISMDLPAEVLAKLLTELAEGEPRSRATPEEAFIAPIDPAVVSALQRLLVAADDPTERRLLAPLIVEEIALRLLRSEAAASIRAAAGDTRDVEKIRAAMRFMREHLREALSVRRVARHVAMSPSHFSHRFSAIARMSPMRYLRQARLEQARALLLGQALRPSEVAPRVGYESAAHFSRDFKSWFGAAPAAYVRQQRNAGICNESADADNAPSKQRR